MIWPPAVTRIIVKVLCIRAALTDAEGVMIGTGKMDKMVIHAANLSISKPLKEIEDPLRKN